MSFFGFALGCYSFYIFLLSFKPSSSALDKACSMWLLSLWN